MNRTHNFVMASLFLLAAVSSGGCNRQNHTSMKTAEVNTGEIEGAVRTVLDEQVQAWNRGDLEGFMKGYWKSDETTFISGDTLTRGWQTVLDRYKKNYESREKMGTLAFTDLEIKPLNNDTAIVNGRFKLTRTADTPQGRFTLIFKRTADGWRISHDHTSVAETKGS